MKVIYVKFLVSQDKACEISLGFYNMVNWNEIADRFFSLYSEKKQSELIRLFHSTQAQVSKWKSYREKIPFKILEQAVDSENVTWDWLLEGHEPRYRSDRLAPESK